MTVERKDPMKDVLDIKGVSGRTYIFPFRKRHEADLMAALFVREVVVRGEESDIIADLHLNFTDLGFLIKSFSEYMLADANTISTLNGITVFLGDEFKTDFLRDLREAAADLIAASKVLEKVPARAADDAKDPE